MDEAKIREYEEIQRKIASIQPRGLSEEDIRTRTDLSGADLQGVILTGANLVETNFRDTKVDQAFFGNNVGITHELRALLETGGAIYLDTSTTNDIKHEDHSTLKRRRSSERILTGVSIYGGMFAQDSSGNIGRGSGEAAALAALEAAQSASDKSSRPKRGKSIESESNESIESESESCQIAATQPLINRRRNRSNAV